MAVPRNRHSNARKNSRRAHMAKKQVVFVRCSNCSATCLPHTICDSCGQYKGKQFVEAAS